MKNYIKYLILIVKLLGYNYLLLTDYVVYAGTNSIYTSIQNGSWNNPAIWSPAIVPINSDIICVSNSVVNFIDFSLTGTIMVDSSGVLTSKNMTVQNGATLIVYGTLYLESLTLNNGSNLHVCSSGVLAISGDFQNKNNTTNVVIDGNLIVGGNFTNGFGGVIRGVGIITVSGFYDGNGDTFGICPTSLIPANSSIYMSLAISLNSFEFYEKNSAIYINWEANITNEEVNLFQIERSEDGENYLYVGVVYYFKGRSNYSFVDSSATNGINYYKISSVDFSGNEKLLNEFEITLSMPYLKEQTIYPNPFNQVINISSNYDEELDFNFKLINSDGVLVFYKSVHQITGNIELIIDNELNSGMYFLIISNEKNEINTYKLFKQNT